MNNLVLCFACILLFGNQLIAKEYSILDYGAEKDKLSTSAIQKAIDNCASDGGGRVIVPAGLFITGTIFLKSNVELYLQCGAELKGSANLDDYKFEDKKYGMFYCEDAINVAISGLGTIHGNGSFFYESDKNHV
ncbi:MAG TPA: hypothetical protein VLR52_03465, partial [Bacteroidales bacterium]|nr:hypothetical protein [Bacteroidales bacterium]